MNTNNTQSHRMTFLDFSKSGKGLMQQIEPSNRTASTSNTAKLLKRMLAEQAEEKRQKEVKEMSKTEILAEIAKLATGYEQNKSAA